MVKVECCISMEYIHFSNVFFAIFHTSMAFMSIYYRQEPTVAKLITVQKVRNMYNCTR
jgi:hypothetical protein